jgi:prophage DNA circulation protein
VALFDEIFQEDRSDQRPDYYVQDLEKVKFVIDGEEKEFVGGSFRGVPFFVESHELTTGRRLVVDNLPNADTNTIQDLGRKTRGISFQAYLLGADVFTQKQALIDAMEFGGIGDLVHPYLGRFKSYGGDLSLVEQNKVKQFARLGLTFVIRNDSVTTKESGNRDAILATAVDKSNSNVLDDFARLFQVVDQANSVVDAAAAVVDTAVNAVFDARASLRNVALFVEKAKSIKTNLAVLLGSPRDLGSELLDLVGFENEDDPERDYKREQEESIAASSFSVETPNTNQGSASDAQTKQNDAAVNSLIKQGNATHAAKVTPSVPYSSVQDASNAIDALGEIFDSAQLAALSDGAYYSALELQTQSADYIAQISKSLATVETIELSHPSTSITVCYELYGNLDNLADFNQRNIIKDPFFLDADTPYEVLTGGGN